jgi:hypothetical protein
MRMRKSGRVIAATALGMAMLAGTSTQAQVVGSATRATQRNCTLVNATQNCDGTGPGQLIVADLYGGGIGIAGATNFTPSPGNTAWSDIRFDAALDLPVIRAYSEATGNLRMNVNTIAFQSYTWTGAAPTVFSISGGLHIVDSSTSPTGGALPGGAIYSQYLGIWDPAVITGLTTPQQLFTQLFYAPCGSAGILGTANGGGTLTGGDATFNLTTAECSPGSLTLAPGQTVLVVAGLQLPVNRGGFADSTATFTTRLGDNLAPEVKDTITASLQSAISQGANVTNVPEPSSWAMLIMGFGLVGAIARRRAGDLARA